MCYYGVWYMAVYWNPFALNVVVVFRRGLAHFAA